MSGADKFSEDDYTFLAFDEAVNPERPRSGYYRPIMNSWWLVHPEKGLAFWNPRNRTPNRRRRQPGLGAPQCNTDKRIADKVVGGTVGWDHEIRFFERVWLPVSQRELTDR